jgi:hypothetical protein
MSLNKESLPRALGDFVGQEQDAAYAAAFGAEVVDGYGDEGVDLKIDDPEIRGLQIKSSVDGMKRFLAESLKRERFIPICVGEPGAKVEMLESIKQFGGWVGRDIPGRDQILAKIAIIRELCHNKEGALKNLLTELG